MSRCNGVLELARQRPTPPPRNEKVVFYRRRHSYVISPSRHPCFCRDVQFQHFILPTGLERESHAAGEEKAERGDGCLRVKLFGKTSLPFGAIPASLGG